MRTRLHPSAHVMMRVENAESTTLPNALNYSSLPDFEHAFCHTLVTPHEEHKMPRRNLKFFLIWIERELNQ